MPDLAEDEDEFTELVGANVPRADLVDRPANGVSGFLLMKGADGSAGLMDPAFVRDLIGKPEPVAKADEGTVTMSGSPAAIARFIHQAAQRQTVEKTKYDADDLKRMAANGQAMADESYPIADRDDLDRAIRAVGRGGADHDAIRRHVIARAKALGASSEIPDNWNSDGSLKGESVTKETTMADGDVLDASVVLAEPEGDAPGMDTTPGSPAWEAIDAATARKWTAILARAKAAVDLLADREMLEAAAGDEGDADQAWNLQDACCAIDYAISVLAPFAVAEQAEAELVDDMTMVGKALDGFDADALDTIEALGHVRKAGRVLSSANEAAIRDAVATLQKVLASLPQAPAAEPVEKTEESPVPESASEFAKGGLIPPANTVASTNQPEPVVKADDVKPQMVAVYDSKGTLVGVVDPGDITRIAGAEPKDDEPVAEAEPVAAPEAAPAGDTEPAPAAEVGTPADATPEDDGVAKTATPDSTTSDVLKSIADVIREQFAVHSATQEQVIAKQAADLAGMAETVETLKGQVKALEEQPAEPRVFTKGQTPPAHLLRGQDHGTAPVDLAKAQELKQVLYKGTATEQNDAFAQMQAMAVAKLQELHQRH